MYINIDASSYTISKYSQIYDRVTPHSTTGISPAKMLNKRKLRTRLNLVQPNIETAVQSKQDVQQSNFNRHKKVERVFEIGVRPWFRALRSR